MKADENIETPTYDLQKSVKRSIEDNEVQEPIAKRTRSLQGTSLGIATQTNMSPNVKVEGGTQKVRQLKRKQIMAKGECNMSESTSTSSLDAKAEYAHVNINDNSTNFTDNFMNVAIVDNGSYNGLIDAAKTMLIEEKIILAMATQNPTADEIQFNGKGWYNGFKIIKCGSQATYNFLKTVVENFGELWPGACLNVVPKCFLQINTNVKVFVPPPYPINDVTMLKLLECQNKHLNVHYWKILNMVPANTGRIYTFGVDRLSMVSLRKNHNIRYGLNVLKANIAKRSLNRSTISSNC